MKKTEEKPLPLPDYPLFRDRFIEAWLNSSESGIKSLEELVNNYNEAKLTLAQLTDFQEEQILPTLKDFYK